MSVGIDLVNIQRFRNFHNSESFLSLVLSNNELEELNFIRDEHERMKFIASRFAVKEALVKCTENKKLDFREISLKHKENGSPYVEGFSVSITYEDDYVCAIVMEMRDS